MAPAMVPLIRNWRAKKKINSAEQKVAGERQQQSGGSDEQQCYQIGGRQFTGIVQVSAKHRMANLSGYPQY